MNRRTLIFVGSALHYGLPRPNKMFNADSCARIRNDGIDLAYGQNFFGGVKTFLASLVLVLVSFVVTMDWFSSRARRYLLDGDGVSKAQTIS
jgi:hypothetical protein